MSIFSWDPKFSIGIQKIDDQHHHLLDIISSLFESMRVGLGFKQVEKTINELRDYALTHFKEEEQFMEKINFPGYQEHIEAHKYFMEMVDDFAKRYREGEIAISLHLLEFLKNWLTNHILIADKELSKYITENE